MLVGRRREGSGEEGEDERVHGDATDCELKGDKDRREGDQLQVLGVRGAIENELTQRSAV